MEELRKEQEALAQLEQRKNGYEERLRDSVCSRLDLLSVKTNKEAIEVRYEDENIWLTQKMLSTLYNVEINTINYHINKFLYRFRK